MNKENCLANSNDAKTIQVTCSNCGQIMIHIQSTEERTATPPKCKGCNQLSFQEQRKRYLRMQRFKANRRFKTKK